MNGQPMNSGVTRRQLPPEFLSHIATLLGDEHEAFVEALAGPRVRGARANPDKIAAHDLARRLPVATEPVPWCDDGLILGHEFGLGGHPAHLAGLFYLQEPSAMAVVEALDPQPGWRVADLAAAPGGKTTHLSSRVGPGGLVVANDVSRKRLRALHDNLDLWGSANVITTSHAIAELARMEGEGFDGVVLDAPCSGEALFRRDPSAVRHWSPSAVEGAAKRQRDLLAAATDLVRPGGVLVYSTCSFSVAENEAQIAALLGADRRWTLEDCTRLLAVDGGVAQPPYATELTARLWPHRISGEGQYVARLRRQSVDGDETTTAVRPSAVDEPGRSGGKRRAPLGGGRRGPSESEVLAGWDRFRRANLWTFHPSLDRLRVVGDRVYALPEVAPPVSGLLPVRPGLPLGRLRPGRFAPDPALATALRAEEAVRVHRWQADDPRLDAFARGEALPDSGPDGWVLVAYEQWGLGWGYRTGDTLKNHMPPHLRRQAAANTRRSAPDR